jgi:hypothetical protein
LRNAHAAEAAGEPRQYRVESCQSIEWRKVEACRELPCYKGKNSSLSGFVAWPGEDPDSQGDTRSVPFFRDSIKDRLPSYSCRASIFSLLKIIEQRFEWSAV